MTAAPRAPSRTASSLILPLLALLGLSLAAAAPARASPIDILWSGVSAGGDDAVGCADALCFKPRPDACGFEATGNACDLLRSLRGWCDGGADCSVGDPTQDHDHDLVPDTVERSVCGRSVVRHALEGSVATASTHCRDSHDLVGLQDGDRDGLPDAAEPTLCGLEDSNTGLDGSCDGTGTDYRV